MAQVGPGLGKSRIIAAVIFMVASRSGVSGVKKPISKFKVVFSDKHLRADEEPNLELLRTYFPHMTITSTSLEEDPESCCSREDELLIIDEADYLLLDRQAQISATMCIALTATAVMKEEMFPKRYLLETLKFRLLDSRISSSVGDTDVEASLSPVERYSQFYDWNKGATLLLFVHDERAIALQAELERRQGMGTVYFNCTDTATLRNLKADDVVLVSRDFLMRGYDYRSSSPKGIALLIAKPSNNRRAVVQAMGRVGRYGEACRRYLLSGTPLVDDQEQGKTTSYCHRKVLYTAIIKKEEQP
jgi:hypothetical protein